MNNMNDFDAATNDSENRRRRNENSYNENAIEWITGDKTATVTFSNGRFVGKVRKLAAEHPDEVKIVKDYGNGILAHIPVKYIRIGAISRKPMTEAEKEKAREWMKHVRMLNNKAPN